MTNNYRKVTNLARVSSFDFVLNFKNFEDKLEYYDKCEEILSNDSFYRRIKVFFEFTFFGMFLGKI